MKNVEIEINGETYVKKSSLKDAEIKELDYVMVRTQSAGVFAGYLALREGQEVTLNNARRIWYWSGASSLSQLSQEGTTDPSNCKFPMEVPTVILTQAIEILPISDKAKKSIEEVKVWHQ